MTKGARTENGETIVPSTNGIGRSGQVHAKKKKIKLNPQHMPHTKINSRWIKDFNISHDARKALEENLSRKISDILCSNIFTDVS